jgi:hypothetical protein
MPREDYRREWVMLGVLEESAQVHWVLDSYAQVKSAAQAGCGFRAGAERQWLDTPHLMK